jgi:methylase of polypeptide subunit release factors
MNRVRRRAWRGWYRARWIAWQRRELQQTRVRSVRGLELVVVPGVLDPALFFSGEVLVDALQRAVRPGCVVLDLGTGSGIGAIAAAFAGAEHVVATDVDPAATRCARANVVLHELEERVQVRQGDLFQPVAGEQFDVIAFNPPWLTSPQGHRLSVALTDPGTLARRFAEGLGAHLAPGGVGLMVLSTSGRADAWLSPLEAAGYALDADIVRERGSETLTAWTIRRPADPLSELEPNQPAAQRITPCVGERDALEPCRFEHRERAEVRKGVVDPTVARVDRIGLEHTRPTVPCMVDNRRQQCSRNAASTESDTYREAHDRPHRLLVDRRDGAGSDEPLEPGSRADAAPSDRFTVQIGQQSAGWIVGQL